MTKLQSTGSAGSSTRPYLIRALHDWCTDNGYTPYLAVYVDRTVQVPVEYVKNHEIVLNVSFDATSGLQLGNEYIEFRARFGGVPRDIVVPVDHVIAIYARENGQGMAFPVPNEAGTEAVDPSAAVHAADDDGAGGAETGGPGLKLAPSPPQEPGASASLDSDEDVPPEPPQPPSAPRPSLKRVK